MYDIDMSESDKAEALREASLAIMKLADNDRGLGVQVSPKITHNAGGVLLAEAQRKLEDVLKQLR